MGMSLGKAGVCGGEQLYLLQGFSEPSPAKMPCEAPCVRDLYSVSPDSFARGNFSHEAHHGTHLGKSCCYRRLSLLAPRKLLSPFDAHTE